MKFGLRHIRHFAAVAEDLHYRKAAERMNIAQPVLTRSVQHLEKELGVVLFDRTNRSVSLTSAGKVFLQGCQVTLATMEGLVSQTLKTHSGEAGHLRIGYTDFAISGELPKILKSFRQLYPDISVEPLHGVTSSQLDLIKKDKLDFGFVTGPINHEDLETRTVQEDNYVAILYDNHPLAKRSSVLLSELADEDFVLGSPSAWQHFHDHLHRICRAAGFVPKMVQHAFNSEGIFGLVACEMGISIHTSCAENYLRKGLIFKKIRDVSDTIKTISIWRNDPAFPARKAFANFLQQYPVKATQQ